jgi:hypothetical protein
VTFGLVSPVLARSMQHLAGGSLFAGALAWLLWQLSQGYRAGQRAGHQPAAK